SRRPEGGSGASDGRAARPAESRIAGSARRRARAGAGRLRRGHVDCRAADLADAAGDAARRIHGRLPHAHARRAADRVGAAGAARGPAIARDHRGRARHAGRALRLSRRPVQPLRRRRRLRGRHPLRLHDVPPPRSATSAADDPAAAALGALLPRPARRLLAGRDERRRPRRVRLHGTLQREPPRHRAAAGRRHDPDRRPRTARRGLHPLTPMCGIAGILSLDGRPAPPEQVRAMCGAIVHRGPDDEGYYVDAEIAMGMRRLSILDLDGGHQPMSNEDGSVWAVFNGEIYNYRELRRQLESRGHVLRTAGDTETLVHLYEEHGADFVPWLRGMFALAIWDRRRRTLLLARDRLGIKPLFYAQRGGLLYFASEVKALLQSPAVDRQLDW